MLYGNYSLSPSQKKSLAVLESIVNIFLFVSIIGWPVLILKCLLQCTMFPRKKYALTENDSSTPLLKGRNVTTTSTSVASEEKVGDLKSENVDLKKQIISVQKENEQMKGLKLDCDKLTQQVNSLQKDHKQRMETKDKRMKELSAQVSKLQSLQRVTSKRIENSTKENEIYKNLNNEIKSAVSKGKEVISKLEKKNKSLLDSVKLLREKQTKSDLRINELSLAKDNLTKEKTEIASKLKVVEMENEILNITKGENNEEKKETKKTALHESMESFESKLNGDDELLKSFVDDEEDDD